MKQILFSILLSISVFTAFPQQASTLYDESADAMAQIDKAIQQAQTEGKYVLCQVGGNWCPWCIRFARMADTDSIIHPIIQDNYIYVHINYSKGNKNPEAMKRLGNPARFGFPVFVILNEKGENIHIQNSAYLEQDKGYSQEKVAEFLKAWTREAVNTLK